MLHRYVSEDTHEEHPLSDTTIIMGIVAVCVFMALALLGAGMIDEGDQRTTQPSTQAPVTAQSKTRAARHAVGDCTATTQRSTQAPPATQSET